MLLLCLWWRAATTEQLPSALTMMFMFGILYSESAGLLLNSAQAHRPLGPGLRQRLPCGTSDRRIPASRGQLLIGRRFVTVNLMKNMVLGIILDLLCSGGAVLLVEFVFSLIEKRAFSPDCAGSSGFP